MAPVRNAFSGGGAFARGAIQGQLPGTNTFPYLNVRDFCAKPMSPGLAVPDFDNTAVFQRALNAAAARGGGRVIVPTGAYRVEGPITIPPNVTLEGEWSAPPDLGFFPEPWWERKVYLPLLKGTCLVTDHGRNLLSPDCPPFITLGGQNSTLKGVAIYYPWQGIPNKIEVSTKEIVPYQYTIGGKEGDNKTVIDVLLINSFRGIDFASEPSGRHHIRRVYGQPLDIGINIAKCYDVGRILDVHFWPFWDRWQRPFIGEYLATRGKALLLGRTDGEIVSNFFAFGYHMGVNFLKSADVVDPPGYPPNTEWPGGPPSVQISNINIDGGDIGLDFNDFVFVTISNCNLNCPTFDGRKDRDLWNSYFRNRIAIRGVSGDGQVMIHGGACLGDFNGALNKNVIVWDCSGMLSMSNLFFHAGSWPEGEAAIRIRHGRAMIEGCYFREGGPDRYSIQIDNSAERVLIVGNQLTGHKIIDRTTNTSLTLQSANHL